MDNPQKPIVLIVDDVAANIQILAEALKSECRIRIANNGEDALRVAMRPPYPDLILLDVMMPGMDGYEVCRRLKDTAATQNIPVIFVTARDDAADEEKGLQVGAVDYIAKPYRLPIVKARVRNHLQLKQKSDLLETLAMIDGLTGIPNRRHFDQRMDSEWRRAVRDRQPLALVLGDVDHFKRFNDHYGHGAGDACLRAVARAMFNSLSRPGDMVARYGGEEFVVILPETGLTGAQQVAERMRQAVLALNIPHALTEEGIVSLSLGYVATWPAQGEIQTAAELLDRVDEGLYKAKREGRNRLGCVDDAT